MRIVYLPNYDKEMARLLVSGVDIWLNTPIPPMEASGTSGMKAAINGVSSLGILDGWWIEGCLEGETDWVIGADAWCDDIEKFCMNDSDSLYQKLDKTILPLFYNDRQQYIQIMKTAIAINGSFFNTQRMMQQYVMKAYF